MGDTRPPAEALGEDLLAIDTMTGGMTQVTAGYLITAPRPALVECGPALSIDNVIAGLHAVGLDADDLAYLIVTHIHLDHAGGAGDVAAAFPNATVVVSEVGARHLHDPERLNASAEQVYGELFDTVYGGCTPIPQERLLAVADGREVDLGGGHRLELLYTPGHAKHHIGVLDHFSGAIFSGDSVGVRLPGMRHLRPATPPPDFHLDAALASIARYRERSPTRLYLAHYGPVDPPGDALGEADDRLRLWAEVAEEAYRTASRRDVADGAEPAERASTRGASDAGLSITGTEVDHVTETLRRRFQDEVDTALAPDDPDAERRIDLLSGFGSNAAGFVRYFRRRDEGTLTPVG